MQSDYKRMFVRIIGTVQGVGFRYFAQHHAQRLGLQGWVRNTPAGAVELQAAGAAEPVDALRSLLEQGPRGAHVTRIEELEPDADELPHPFAIRRDFQG